LPSMEEWITEDGERNTVNQFKGFFVVD
jgi:hypothetical protein